MPPASDGCGRRRQCLPSQFTSTAWRRVPVAQSRDYAQIEQQLQDLHAMTEAAEAHGTLAGSLCAAGRYRIEDWIGEILPDEVVAQGPAPALRTLFEETTAALAGQSMEFNLLLPDDEEPLERRTEALCLWCNGFIYGLGTAGHSDPTRLPGDAGEIVRDFNQIMQAGVDESEGDEANESAFAELVEFVRVGVQIVYEQLASQREQPSEPAVALH
ncbi:MAG: UPF0149 family protein [Steroidobacteraceae bacterium]